VGSSEAKTDAINGNSDIGALRGDVAPLKDDMGRLIEHLKGAPKNSLRNLANQFNRSIRGLSESASAQGERSVKTLGAWVGEELMLAVLIAFGMGYVGASVISR
jgi:hypothetical protein